jgi:hypothetical protein
LYPKIAFLPVKPKVPINHLSFIVSFAFYAKLPFYIVCSALV